MSRRWLFIASAMVVLATASTGYLVYTRIVTTIPGTPLIGGPFRLTAQDGTEFDSRTLEGKPYAVFFGFTHCPEVCPTTMLEVSHVFDELGDKADDLTVYFITVDPERDTPDVLQDYVSSFTGRIVGLSGTPEQIADVAKKFRVYYEKVPTSDGDYTINHSASIYLMGRDGLFKSLVSFNDSPQEFLRKFEELLSE
jgi:protein SCO1/2